MREFAVLILLTEKEDGLHFVFEKPVLRESSSRATSVFREEKSSREKAGRSVLRETREEIGLTEIELLGEYATQYELTSIAMHSLAGFVREEKLSEMRINEGEVAEVFTVPVRFFAENEPYLYEYDVIQDVRDFPYEQFGIRSDYKWRVGHKSIAIYRYEDKIIWGLTAAIVKRFTEEFFCK